MSSGVLITFRGEPVMTKPYNKTIEDHLLTYKKRNILEYDLIEYKNCTLLVSTDIFDQGTKFELIKIDYTAMTARMWIKDTEEKNNFFEYEICIGLI